MIETNKDIEKLINKIMLEGNFKCRKAALQSALELANILYRQRSEGAEIFLRKNGMTSKIVGKKCYG